MRLSVKKIKSILAPPSGPAAICRNTPLLVRNSQSEQGDLLHVPFPRRAHTLVQAQDIQSSIFSELPTTNTWLPGFYVGFWKKALTLNPPHAYEVY